MKRLYISLILTVFVTMCMPITNLLALDVPPLKGKVNDYANMLSKYTASQIEHKLADLEAKDSTQVVVLTVESLDGNSIEDFSMKVAETWKIGQAKKDNGVIFTISKKDRRMRIEVGYGLEGELTDAMSGRILDNIVSPHFKQGNYNAGIEDGINAIIAVVKQEYVSGVTLRELTQENLSAKVNDYANLLSKETTLRIEQKFDELNKTESIQMAILTVVMYDGDNLTNFAKNAAETWRKGQAITENSVFFVISKEFNNTHIETGTDLNNVLTNIIKSRILNRIVDSFLINGNYNDGIERGIDTIIKIVKGESVEGVSSLKLRIGNLQNFDIANIVFWMLFFIFCVRIIMYRVNEVGLTNKKIFGGIISGGLFIFPLSLALGDFDISNWFILLFGIICGLIIAKLPSSELFVPRIFRRRDKITFEHYGNRDWTDYDSYSDSYSYSSSDSDSYSGGGGDFGGGGASGSW